MAITNSQFPIKITTEFEPAGAQQAGDALKKVGEHAEGAEVKTRALHTALAKFGEAGGMLGELLHLAEQGGPYAALLGIAAAVGMIVEQINALTERIKESIEESM